jgi:UPF0716 family protein affecting phage T7 exclusion
MRYPNTGEPGLLEKFIALIAGAILLVVGFMFSLLLFAVIVSLGLLVWGYFWWKTRKLRRAMREQAQSQSTTPAGGQVIEGEAIIVEMEKEAEHHSKDQLPPGSG